MWDHAPVRSSGAVCALGVLASAGRGGGVGRGGAKRNLHEGVVLHRRLETQQLDARAVVLGERGLGLKQDGLHLWEEEGGQAGQRACAFKSKMSGFE